MPLDPSIQIATEDGRTAYEPGELVAVVATWAFSQPPSLAQLRLTWYTQGKGDSDVKIVQTVPLDAPQASESRRCELLLPESPYSFSGRLISLIWAIELVFDGERSARFDLVVAPGAKEVVLQEVVE